jgi:hypothetical protein
VGCAAANPRRADVGCAAHRWQPKDASRRSARRAAKDVVRSLRAGEGPGLTKSRPLVRAGGGILASRFAPAGAASPSDQKRETRMTLKSCHAPSTASSPPRLGDDGHGEEGCSRAQGPRPQARPPRRARPRPARKARRRARPRRPRPPPGRRRR